MSAYINTKTNQYPVYEGDIRLLYPEMGTTFVVPDDYAEVEEGTLPETEPTQCREESLPKLNNMGIYERVFAIRDLTNEEIAAQKSYKESIGRNLP